MTDEQNEGISYDASGKPVLDPNIRKHMRDLEEQNKLLQAQVRTSNLGAICDQLKIPSDGVGKLFRDTFTGEVTFEAIKTAADSYGLIPSEGSGDEGGQTDLDALKRINSLTDPNQSKDAEALMEEILNKLKAAKTEAEFDAIYASPEYQALRNQKISTLQ